MTGFRYLLAVLVLILLATGPMVLAVAAGLTTLTSSTQPDPEPFLRPADTPADHDLRVMIDPDPGPEAHDPGRVEYR